MRYDDKINAVEKESSIVQDALKLAVYIPIHKEFGSTKSDVISNLAHKDKDAVDTYGFNMFMNICTFLCENRHDAISSEDYIAARDIAYRKALAYINGNHEFSAAYRFYVSTYLPDQFPEMLLFSKNIIDSAMQIINAKMAIRTIHYINELRKSEENMFIYNLDLLDDIMHKYHMRANFTTTNRVNEYEHDPLVSGAPAFYKFGRPRNELMTNVEDFCANMGLYCDFLSAIVSGDNEKAYDMLPEEDKNLIAYRR